MKSMSIFLLVGLLTIWTELPSACGQKQVTVKPGTCPPDNIKCIPAEPEKCAMDSDCTQDMKCCYCQNAMSCIEPVEETPGTCPAITSVCPMVDPPNLCEKDSNCPEKKKCCDTGCGIDCVWPDNSTHLF